MARVDRRVAKVVIGQVEGKGGPAFARRAGPLALSLGIRNIDGYYRSLRAPMSGTRPLLTGGFMNAHGLRQRWIVRVHTRPGARTFAVLVLTAGLITACVSYRWQPVAVTNISLQDEQIRTRVARFMTPAGSISLAVTAVIPPYVEGRALEGSGTAQVNLATARRISIVDFGSGRRTARQVTQAAWRDYPDSLVGRVVEVETPQGSLVLGTVSRVEDGWITGPRSAGNGLMRVDLRDVSVAEIREFDGPATVLKTALGATATVAVVALIVALTKESCPFVYVDRGEGWELVGEAYAGAAFRSTQRDDLLPLLAVGDDRRVRVRLRNEARETQYTDRAELLVVDHAPAVRALATFNGHPLLVSTGRSPISATDHAGTDVLRLVSATDGTLWETDPDEVAAVEDGRLEDRLTVQFETPGEGSPVLELTGGNTPWLDLIFGRFFAAMGDRLDHYLTEGNDPAAGSRIRGWREREGVDLIVEMQTNGAWRQIAAVPTVGPAALREVAIPLPVDRSAANSPIVIRLRGGLGFWRLDRVALSTRDGSTPSIHRLRPTSARGTGDSDERDAIGATDGRYNALSEMNESIDMDFELPPVVAGRSRSVFLSSSGYYNVHPPIQSRWQPGTLKAIRDDPGALSRFGRELALQYRAANTTASSNLPVPRDHP